MYHSLRSELKFYFKNYIKLTKFECGVRIVFVNFYGKIARIKKELIFWLDHGLEVQTCTEVAFLKSDEKTIFKTSFNTSSPRSSLPQVGCVRGANTFPNHNKSLTRESLTMTSPPGFPSNLN